MARTKGTKQLGVELNAALLDEFKGFCEQRGETVRKHLEMAIRRHIDNPPPMPAAPPPLPPVTTPGAASPAPEPSPAKKKPPKPKPKT
jgi:transposase InsO family protein